MNLSFLNEYCLQWSFGDTLDEATIRTTLAAFRKLKECAELCELGVCDLVPAYNKLGVHFPGNEPNHAEIAALLTEQLSSLSVSDTTDAPYHHLLVNYSGPDLERVAELAGLSVEEVIVRHSAPEYLVAMIGFQPHFPYLFGLDPMLETPRLATPRLRVPAGSVAIGGAQTGVYPSESPGGWNLIGQTDPLLLKKLNPGDRIRFVPVEVPE
jgi:inhibitor of KinA